MNTYTLTLTRKIDNYIETLSIQAKYCPTEAWIIKYPNSKLLKEVPKEFYFIHLMPNARAMDNLMLQVQVGDWPHCAWYIEGYNCLLTAFCPAKQEIIEPKEYWREENICR